MATLLYTGNSEPQSAIVLIKNPGQEGDVQLTIQGIDFFFAEWNVETISQSINTSGRTALSAMTATPSGSDIVLEDTSGRDIVVSLVVRVAIDIETIQHGRPKTAQITYISLPSTTTGGTWTLTINGETTGALASDLSAATLQTAVDGLATPAPGEIIVSKTGPRSYRLEFNGQYLGATSTVTANGNNLTGQAALQVTTTQFSGANSKAVFQLLRQGLMLGGTSSVRLYVNDINCGLIVNSSGSLNGTTAQLLTQIKAALGSDQIELFKVATGDPTYGDDWLFIAFGGDFIEGGTLPAVRLDGPDGTYPLTSVNDPLTGGTSQIFVISGSTVFFGTGGSSNAKFRLDYDGTQYEASGVAISGINALLTSAFEADNYTSTLIYQEDGLNGTKVFSYLVMMKEDLAQLDLGELVFTYGMVGGSFETGTITTMVVGAEPINEIQRIAVINGVGGTLKMKFGNVTAPATLAFPTTASAMQAHLETISTIGAGNVTVTGGNLTVDSPLFVEFIDTLGNQNVAALQADVSLVTGGLVLLNTTPADPGASEAQKVQLRGVASGGTWRLELDNIRADRVDFDADASELQAALEVVVGAGNVTVASGGPRIYLIGFVNDWAFRYVSELQVNENDLVLANPADLIVYVQAANGPEHWNNGSNWRVMETGQLRIPHTGDDVFLEKADLNIRFGLVQQGVFTANPTTDELYCQQHSLKSGQIVRLTTTGTLPAPLDVDEDYVVILSNPYASWIKLALAGETTIINITNQGTGVHTIGVKLNSYRQKASFDGDVGLPRFDEEGLYQLSPEHLRIGFMGDKICVIGEGTGNGSSMTKIDIGTDEAYFRVLRTANNAEAPAGAVQILVDNDQSEIRVDGGNVSVALMAGEQASFNLLQANGGQINLGKVNYKAHEASVSAVVTATDAILTGPMKVS